MHQNYSYLLIHMHYSALCLQDPILCHILFHALYFSSQHCHQYHLQKNYHKTLAPLLPHPQVYNYIFQKPTSYPSKNNYTKQPNLHHLYFTPLPHILPDIISIYSLPLTPSGLPIDVTVVPPGARPTGFLSTHHVFTPSMNIIIYPT